MHVAWTAGHHASLHSGVRAESGVCSGGRHVMRTPESPPDRGCAARPSALATALSAAGACHTAVWVVRRPGRGQVLWRRCRRREWPPGPSTSGGATGPGPRRAQGWLGARGLPASAAWAPWLVGAHAGCSKFIS